MSEPAQDSSDTAEILFPEGIIGVPRARRFHLLERADSRLRYLNSLDIQGFRLPVVDPFLVDPGYAPRLGSRVGETLRADETQPLLMLAIANVTDDGVVANLRAPLIVNVGRRCGLQIILDDARHPLRAPVCPESLKAEALTLGS